MILVGRRSHVFGDDMRIFLALARSFGRAGKEVHAVPANRDAPALKSRYVTTIHRITSVGVDTGKWRREVEALLEADHFDLIVPCVDPVQIAMDLNRDIFEGLNLAIPSRENWDTFFDKKRTHEVSASLGIPVADCAELAAADTADTLIARYGLPVVIKPQRSNRADRLAVSEKVVIAVSRQELEAFLSRLEDRDGFIAEAYFTGQGVGVSVLARHGEIVQAFQHRRLREGWGGSSSYRISEALHPGMLEACRKLMRHTGHHGVCMFEFRHDPDSGKWILLETNSRFWGSMPLPVAIGVDFPNQLFDLHQGAEVKTFEYQPGIRSRNLVLDGFNIARSPFHGKPVPALIRDIGDFLFLQPMRWLAGTEKSDSFVADDIRPGLHELAKLPVEMMRKAFGSGS